MLCTGEKARWRQNPPQRSFIQHHSDNHPVRCPHPSQYLAWCHVLRRRRSLVHMSSGAWFMARNIGNLIPFGAGASEVVPWSMDQIMTHPDQALGICYPSCLGKSYHHNRPHVIPEHVRHWWAFCHTICHSPASVVLFLRISCNQEAILPCVGSSRGSGVW